MQKLISRAALLAAVGLAILGAGPAGAAQASSTAGLKAANAGTLTAIYNAINVLHSGKCLDTDISGDNAFRDGAKVQQWDCLNGTNQRWTWVPVGGGWSEIRVQHSDKCLDIDIAGNQRYVNGAKAQQWTCNGNANQHFRLVSADTRPMSWIQVQHSGKCLDEDISGDNGFRNGGKVQQWDCRNGTNQLWHINGD